MTMKRWKKLKTMEKLSSDFQDKIVVLFYVFICYLLLLPRQFYVENLTLKLWTLLQTVSAWFSDLNLHQKALLTVLLQIC